MTKNIAKNRKRSAELAARVEKTSEIAKVSKSTVYKVISGDRTNETVMQTYMFLYEGENMLLQQARSLVAF